MGAHAKKSGCDIHRMRCIFPVLSAVSEEKPENMNYLTICSCRYTGRNGFRDRAETTQKQWEQVFVDNAKMGSVPTSGGVFGPIFGLSPHFRKKTNTCSRLVLTNKQTFDGKGDKRGQKGTKGTNFVPIFVPSKTPVYRNNLDFLEQRFDGRGQTGDKQGTKMGTKTPKWGILIRPM